MTDKPDARAWKIIAWHAPVIAVGAVCLCGAIIGQSLALAIAGAFLIAIALVAIDASGQ